MDNSFSSVGTHPAFAKIPGSPEDPCFMVTVVALMLDDILWGLSEGRGSLFSWLGKDRKKKKVHLRFSETP